MVRGLLADVAKKKLVGFGRVSGLATPQPLEHLLGGARWDADVLREQVRGYVLRGRALADAALAFSWFVADSGDGARPGPAPVLPRQPGVLCAGRPGGPARARRVRQATSPRRGVGRYPEHRMAAAFGR